jgi:hypothetical protein
MLFTLIVIFIKVFIKQEKLGKLGKEEEETTRCCAQRLHPHSFSALGTSIGTGVNVWSSRKFGKM